MNSLDFIFIISILIALSFRVSNVKQLLITARLIYCVNTIYWVIKLMEFLLINKYVGPLIIIASRMLVDLLNFIIILVILLMCFGLSRQAIKYPNEEFRWELVKAIFLEPYFMLYGEVYADTIDATCDYEKNPDSPECQPGHWITPITMTIFMIVACLLFLSILIASFNNTFVRISRQSALFWKCQRYHFVTSYEAKPIFGPPFTLFILILRIIKYSIRLCSGKKIKFDRKLKSFLSDDMIQRLHDFEENCVYEYSCDLEQSIKNQMEEKINHTKNQVESISARIDDIFFKENMTKLSLYKVELRLQKLEEFAFETMEKINVIANSLSSKNFEKSDLLNTSQYSLLNRSRRRNITVCESFDRSHLHPNSSYPTRLSRSPGNNIKYNKSVSNIENGQSKKNSSVEKTCELIEVLDADERPKIFAEPNNSEKSSKLTEASNALPDFKTEEDFLKKHSGQKKSKNRSDSSLDTVNRVDNLGDSTKESDSDISDDDESRKILKSIYTSKSDSQQLQGACQFQTGLDQYTLHPFVYLHPVIKPPLAEYTSITDCIDTSNIDRPPSPTILNKSGTFKLNESAKFNHTKLANLNDYCSNDTARSAVARQESEILRLAEESQHVIINQMLNQIVKTSESSSQKSREDERQAPIFNLESDKSPEQAQSPTNAKKPPIITFNTGSEEDLQTEPVKKMSQLIVNEEDETGKLPNFKKRETREQKTFKKPNFKQNTMPLSMLDRNSSQIFYAQSQANVLCSNESEREEENILKH